MMSQSDTDKIVETLKPVLAGLIRAVRERYPTVPSERGKAILLDVLNKALVSGGDMDPIALTNEVHRRFAAECA